MSSIKIEPKDVHNSETWSNDPLKTAKADLLEELELFSQYDRDKGDGFIFFRALNGEVRGLRGFKHDLDSLKVLVAFLKYGCSKSEQEWVIKELSDSSGH